MVEIVIVVILAAILGGFIQGTAGFGFGIITVSIIPLVLGFRDSISLMTLLMVGVATLMFIKTRRQFAWNDCKNLLIGVFIGVPSGVMVILLLQEVVLLKLFGLLNVSIGLYYFLYNRKRGKPFPDGIAIPIGYSGGILAGAFNMGGPPMIAFLYSKPWDLDRIKSVLATATLSTSFLRLPFVGITMEHPGIVLPLFAACLVPIWFAMNAGFVFARKVSAQKIRTGVHAYLGIMGCYYLFLH
jgi:hypothetical protein